MRRHRPLLLLAIPAALAAPVALATADPAKDPPAQVMADAAKALSAVTSYRVIQTSTSKAGTTRLAAAVDTKARSFDLTLSDGSASSRVIGIRSKAYVKANAAYWRGVFGKGSSKAAKAVANRWIALPAAESRETVSAYADLLPKEIAKCVTVGLGTLKTGGATTVGGKPAVEIVDQGDRPGTTPGTYAIATSGPPLILRAKQTGRRKPGGKIDKRCQDEDDSSTSASLAFSRFGDRLGIKAPKRSIDLPDGDSGSGTSDAAPV